MTSSLGKHADAWASSVRDSWVIRSAFGTTVVAFLCAPLLLAESHNGLVITLIAGLSAGAAMALAGRAQPTWVAASGALCAACTVGWWAITQNVVLVLLAYLVCGAISTGLFLLATVNDRSHWVVMLGVLTLSAVLGLAAPRAFGWEWFGGPVFFVGVCYPTLPAVYLLSRLWQSPESVRRRNLARLAQLLRRDGESTVTNLAESARILDSHGRPDLAHTRQLLQHLAAIEAATDLGEDRWQIAD